MKLVILHFLWATLLMFNISNQAIGQNKLRPIKLYYKNDSGERGISYYEYDGNGKMIKGRWQQLDKDRWSINYFRYNKKGQQIEKYREFSDSLITSLNFRYNENGRPSSEYFWGTDGRDGTTTFIYDEDGHLSEADCHEYYGWIDGKMAFVCDENGLKESAQLFKDDTVFANVSFEYDDFGNLQKEYWKFIVNWSQTFVYEFEQAKTSFVSSNAFISENNRFRLINENYSFNGESSGLSEFRYDDSGKLIEKVFVRSDGLETTTSYNYDEKGLITRSIRKYSDGTVGAFTYEFSPQRKISKRHYKNSGRTMSKEEYYYDYTGRLISAKWENFDGWLTGNISFYYSRNNLIESGKFIGDGGLNAELTFSYDGDGNLSRIHWEFNNGKTQDYWFEYSPLY